MTAKGEYFPYGVDLHVADMQYASDVNHEGPFEVELTPVVAPIAADGDLILDGQSIATAVEVSTFETGYTESEAQMGKFGRNITVVASGAATSKVTVYGYDYLGQLMAEEFTLNATTVVAGKKAFRYVTLVDAAATADRTIDVGVGSVFGLPYKMLGQGVSYTDKAQNANAGTFVAGVDTQTMTSGDPRGTWSPHGDNAANGSRQYTLLYRPDRDNLHGNKHVHAA